MAEWAGAEAAEGPWPFPVVEGVAHPLQELGIRGSAGDNGAN